MSKYVEKPEVDERGYLTEMHIEYDLDKMYVWLVGEDVHAPASVGVEFMKVKNVNKGKYYPLFCMEPENGGVPADDLLKIIRLAKQYAKKLDSFKKAA